MIRVLAVLLMSLALPPALAGADAPEGAASPPRPGLDRSDASRREDAPPTADPNSPEQGDGGGARAAESADDGSPFDYQASEEISEDLSVSFPVDI